MFSIVSNQFVRHCLFPLVVLIAFSSGCCVHPLQDDKIQVAKQTTDGMCYVRLVLDEV